MKHIYILLIVFQAFILISCGLFADGEEVKTKPVARVHDIYLYHKDLQSITNGASPKDSVDVAQRYIDSWVKEQLLVHEAQNNTTIDMNEIDKRVQEYKYQLLIYAYQKSFIEKNLDTVVTQAQIETYYKENQRNFELKQNIVKGVLLKVPKNASKLDKLRGWLRSDNGNALEEVKSYAYSFAEVRVISDTTWIDFEEMIVGTPFVNTPNRVQLLSKSKNLEIAEEDFFYFLKIVEYKIADQISPLTYLRGKIIDIILNKRKIELQDKYEDAVLDKAEKEKTVEIFN
ncbi:MAG: peptidyl-prolyl cis-trans isomerase [Cytophagales bacterium]|nr:MAG: peptidyl-prolyl cis-trans isomerase [Cytophagales bacterium]